MKITSLSIVTGGETPVLRAVGAKVQDFDTGLKKLIEAMAKVMRDAKGIGIAAPQVGKSLQLFVIDKLAFSPKESAFKFLKGNDVVVGEFFAVVNPRLNIRGTGTVLGEEGCLSLPEKSGYVARAKKLVLRGQTASGHLFKLQAKGLLARVIQHEYDHLQGILISDKFVRPT